MTPLREKHDGALGSGSPSRTSVRLWLRLLSCTMIIEKRLKRLLAERHATTLPRFDVLAALDRHPDGMTMGALSRSLLVSNGNVTALVQTLQRDGLITLTPSPHDRRAQVVALTPAGHSDFARLAQAHHGWIDGWLSGLDHAEREQLFALLGRLKDSIGLESAL